MSNKHFNLCEAEISLGKIIKSINSETNNKSGGNNGLTTAFSTYFSNELAPVLLHVYESCGELGSISVTSRTGIISTIYKKDDKNYRSISLLNLDYKIYTTDS